MPFPTDGSDPGFIRPHLPPKFVAPPLQEVGLVTPRNTLAPPSAMRTSTCTDLRCLALSTICPLLLGALRHLLNVLFQRIDAALSHDSQSFLTSIPVVIIAIGKLVTRFARLQL